MSPLLDEFRDSVVVVTGATGFIGAHLVTRLCALGAEVHGIARSKQKFEHSRFHPRTLNLGDYPALENAVRSIKPTFVFHLASHVMGAPDLKHVLPTFHANLGSTVNLLTACAESGHGLD